MYRILSDHEILTEEHFCKNDARGVNMTKVTNSSCIGRTVGECRKLHPNFTFHEILLECESSSNYELIFEKFNFLGEI